MTRIVLFAAVICLMVTFNEFTSAATPGDILPGYFEQQPFLPTYEQRRAEYLKLTAEKEPNDLFGVLAPALLGYKNLSVSDASLNYALERINSRVDCADFSMIRIVRLIYFDRQYNILTPEQRKRVHDAVLGFKYWVDEPGPDKMISWTENHQILFHASEYLAGQFFPDEIFTNNGKTGRWHLEHARPLLIRWIQRRARWGFSEWDSNVYYGEDLPGILNLADLAQDKEVANLAAMAVDIMLLDMAPDLFKGVYASSHGRTYAPHILDGRNRGLNTLTALVFGVSKFNGFSDMSAVSMATGSYRPPEAILKMALDPGPELVTLERHGIPLEKMKDYGLDFGNLDDIPALWGMGVYSQHEVLDTTFRAVQTWDLWDAPYFEDAAQYMKDLGGSGSLSVLVRGSRLESDRTLLGEADKYTFRTPDYMLSTAQDYRPGGMGNQHHLWQATLTPDAAVFVTNPGSLISDDRTPCYWAGQNRFPRSAQYKNVHISIYNLDGKKALGERGLLLFTHAFFPKPAFDQVVEREGWIFGRAGNGYIALYANRPGRWNTEGEFAGRDYIVDGNRTVWICVLGRKADDGSFEEFINEILSARLEIKDLNVKFEAPGVGIMELGWTGPFKVNGKEVSLRDYPWIQNQFARSDFNSGVFEVQYGSSRLFLDFNKGIREIEN